MENRRVTLKDIADAARVSRSTVSQALRGAGKISQATQERVRRIAEELGYRPDPLLSAFSRHRTPGASPGSVIGMIFPGPVVEVLMETLTEPTDRLGYRLEPFSVADYSSQKALVKVLQARGVAGVIFPQADPRLVLEPGVWEPLRGVYCGNYPALEDHPCPFPIVRQGSFDALTLAWHKAVAAGYERIGCILLGGKDLKRGSIEKTLACYRYRQATQNPPLVQLAPLVEDYQAFRSRPEITHRWIETQKPDVVIGYMYGIYEQLIHCGYRMPEDFGFINLRHKEGDARVAGIIHDRVAINREALYNLHSIIQFGHEMHLLNRKAVTIDPIWQDGATLPDRR